MTPAAVFALGKFAGEAEYLRVDGGEAVAGLETWIDEAVAFAHRHRGEAWRSAFPEAGPIAVIWQPGQARESDELLCGVMAPSRDAVGRDYPLVIAGRFSEGLVARVPQLTPLVFGDFFDSAYATIAEVRSGTVSSAEFIARTRAIALPAAPEVSMAEADYAAWCRKTTVREAWSVIFAGSTSLVSADRALASLIRRVSEGRLAHTPAMEGPPVGANATTAIRLPLGSGGAAAAALWLDIVHRLGRGSRATPSAFWRADGSDLLLTFGHVRSVLADLWCPRTPDEAHADLESPADVVRAGDGSATMHDWLNSLLPGHLRVAIR